MGAEYNTEDHDMQSEEQHTLSIEDVGLIIDDEIESETSIEETEDSLSEEREVSLEPEILEPSGDDASLAADSEALLEETPRRMGQAVEGAADGIMDEIRGGSPAKPDAAPETEPLAAGLERMAREVAQLNEEFRSKIKYDLHKEKIIDSLHQELQAYKNDIVKKHLLSVLMDVIKIIDDIRKWLNHYRVQDASERDPHKLFKYLESIPSDLEDIFYWQGVKPFTCKGDTFDGARQRVTKKVETADESLDKTVAESLRAGYEWEGKVIRPEMVAIYSYKQTSAELEERNINE